MKTYGLAEKLLTAVTIGTVALSGPLCASAAPVPTGIASLTTAVPPGARSVGYFYRDLDGAWLNSSVAVGFVGASAVTPFYTPSYYPAYIYAAPPAYYAPLPYEGPAIVYGRPLLAADPYYAAFYPYVRGPRYWLRYR